MADARTSVSTLRARTLARVTPVTSWAATASSATVSYTAGGLTLLTSCSA